MYLIFPFSKRVENILEIEFVFNQWNDLICTYKICNLGMGEGENGDNGFLDFWDFLYSQCVPNIIWFLP
jgi:hypothetical protein